jgi:cell division protein FtsZ
VPAPVKEEKVVFTLDDQSPATPVSSRPEVTEARLTQSEHQARVEERLARMREVSQKLRTPNGLNDMEREPAYKRKNIQINDVQHSTDSTVSRYTLSEETDEHGERRVELKRNNPYLHDNVD